MKGKVKAKQEAYNALVSSGTEEEKELNKKRYKMAKRGSKNAVTIAKNIAYGRLYQKLETNEGENEVFKLAMARERSTRDLVVQGALNMKMVRH